MKISKEFINLMIIAVISTILVSFGVAYHDSTPDLERTFGVLFACILSITLGLIGMVVGVCYAITEID
jgi:hypothetical protein